MIVPQIDVVLFSCCTIQCCTILMFHYVMLHYFDTELFDIALANVTLVDLCTVLRLPYVMFGLFNNCIDCCIFSCYFLLSNYVMLHFKVNK